MDSQSQQEHVQGAAAALEESNPNETVLLPVKRETRNKLKTLKMVKKESYDELFNRLLFNSNKTN